MDLQQLKQRLAELHRELTIGTAVDPEARELLRQLSADIDGLLQPPEGGNASAEERSAALAERQTVLDSVLNLTREFEETHPQLAATLGRIADALSRIGI